VKTVEWCAKDNFAASSDRLRNPAFREQAQQILVAESTQLPARVQFRGEIKYLLIQKRVTNFDRGVHGHAVAFGLQQIAR